jgi:hypothetical protein
VNANAQSFGEVNEDRLLAELIEEYTTRLQNGEPLTPDALGMSW